MIDDNFIRDRITELRMQKDVSEYKMSLDMGHSTSYIRSITSGKALPSMGEFLYMCEYFGITPAEFFDENIPAPLQLKELNSARGTAPRRGYRRAYSSSRNGSSENRNNF